MTDHVNPAAYLEALDELRHERDELYRDTPRPFGGKFASRSKPAAAISVPAKPDRYLTEAERAAGIAHVAQLRHILNRKAPT